MDRFKLFNSKACDLNQINMKGKINHSVCKWCYSQIPLEEFAKNVKSMGIKEIGPHRAQIMDSIKKTRFDILYVQRG